MCNPACNPVAVEPEAIARAVSEAAGAALLRGDVALADQIVREYRERLEAERREEEARRRERLRQPVLTIAEARALRRR